MTATHLVNVSGGKDSAACYLLALERQHRTGRAFRAVFADTGHEHPETYGWVRRLAERTGGPEVEIVRADFAERIARKRETIARRWPEDGVPPDQIARALELLHPTGNPFLDLCMLKGRFPSPKARFCTEELKVIPVERTVLLPALARGPVVQWQGERRGESRARARLPRGQRVRWLEPRSCLLVYRPILEWTADDVFALHRRHGLPPNPLYLQGMGRVGCMPCIMCRKGELREIAGRWPEQIARVAEWERVVAAVSKRGLATFFAADKTPEGALLARHADRLAPAEYPAITEVAAWAQTAPGGRQLLLELEEPGALCASMYGLCE